MTLPFNEDTLINIKAMIGTSFEYEKLRGNFIYQSNIIIKLQIDVAFTC